MFYQMILFSKRAQISPLKGKKSRIRQEKATGVLCDNSEMMLCGMEKET